jgi:SRSO17 transposase
MGETGDRQSGTQTAHMDWQSLGSAGKMDHGLVVVSTLWADDARDYPRHAEPYTPARWCLKGKTDTAFRTKPQMALQLIEAAFEMGILFRAIMADRGDGEHPPVMEALVDAVHTP